MMSLVVPNVDTQIRCWDWISRNARLKLAQVYKWQRYCGGVSALILHYEAEHQILYRPVWARFAASSPDLDLLIQKGDYWRCSLF